MSTEAGCSASAFYFDLNQQWKLFSPFIAGVSPIVIELTFAVVIPNISNFSLADCQVLLVHMCYVISGILLFFPPIFAKSQMGSTLRDSGGLNLALWSVCTDLPL